MVIKRIIEDEHEGMMLRTYLQSVLHLSRRLLKAIIHEGGKIIVNKNEVTVRYLVQAGDQLEILFPKEKKGKFMFPEKIPLDIIYEDPYLIILNKQKGIVVSPSPLHPSGTIANGLLYYYTEQGHSNTVHIVTRLDRDTTGLLLVAKNRYIHSLFSKDLSNQRIERRYLAIVEGKLVQKDGTIEAKIGRKKDSIIEREVTDEGKEAITHYKVLKETSSYSLVNVSLETGRTHQIRVHFFFIGHPLAGDTLYGGNKTHINRQALHCSKLCFIHPITGEEFVFEKSLPSDMRELLERDSNL